MNSQDDQTIQVDFDYEQLEGVLADNECDASAAEIQAFFCGLLAAGATPKDLSWRRELIDMVNDGQPLNETTMALLSLVYAWSSEEMSQHESLAPVLIPDDSYPAIDQLDALIDWCEGFLLGFGLQTGNRPINNSEVDEALTDLAEICRLELEAEETPETQEALMTLVEHIKVAVQIIHWEMVAKNTGSIDPRGSGAPTIH